MFPDRLLGLRDFEPIRFRSLTVDQLMDYVVRPMAEKYQVSIAAMRIRLETLGLSFAGRTAELDIDEPEMKDEVEA
jgi:hypothetical protein